jgi:hypothetical protein
MTDHAVLPATAGQPLPHCEIARSCGAAICGGGEHDHLPKRTSARQQFVCHTIVGNTGFNLDVAGA